jgi:hypothetical protein
MDHMTKSIVAIFATFAVLAIGFFAYDLLKPAVSPCETIFQQTTTSLGSKLEILKAKGEIFIGKEKIQDLTERAQITALNLKTCCVVLDAGAVNSDQFLQCQGSARGYEQQIEAAAAQAGEANAAQQQGQTDLVDAKVRAINDSLTAAQQQSQLLQQTLVQLVQPSSTPLVQPGSTPLLAPSSTPAAVPAAGQQAQATPGGESEPNNDPQHATPIAVDAWIDAAIADANDDDYFKVTSAAGNRDIYRVEVENRSTTWAPALRVLDAQKSPVTSASNSNQGADLALSFSGDAGADYYVAVGRYGNSAGEYRLRVAARHAFDRYEPNDTIIQATPIGVGAPVAAGIMDADDFDYYRVTAPAGIAKMHVLLDNRSTTLAPSMTLYDGRKSKFYYAYDGTQGANLDLDQAVKPSADYYVLVDKYGNSAGEYALTVSFE